MATIGNSFLGIADYYKRSDRNGNIGSIIEALHQINPLMQDAYVQECNNGHSHLSTIRTGLGEGSWTKLYQGIKQSKSTTQQVEDTTGMLERLSTVDTRFLKRIKNPGRARMTEASAALEWIGQEVQTNFFYADTATTPERFKGVAARYNAISGGGAAASQIVDAGGTGSDNTSVWFITWGEAQTSLIYPEGTAGGVQRVDKGEQLVTDPNGDPYFVKMEWFGQEVGTAVGDWRYNTRVANIDVSDLLAGTVDIYRFLRQGYWKLQGRRNSKIQNDGMISQGRTIMYANRDVLQALDAQASNDGASDNFVRLTPDEVAGKEVLTYRGIPIRETDALINNEARVV